MAIPVLIATSHDVVASALASMLEETEFQVAGFAETSGETLEMIAAIDPAVVLLDTGLRDISGVSVLDRVCASHPGLPVLMLTSYENPLSQRTFLAHGAAGSYVKGSARELLLVKLRHAAVAVPFEDLVA